MLQFSCRVLFVHNNVTRRYIVKEALSTHDNDQWQRHLNKVNLQKPGFWILQKILHSNQKTYPVIYGQHEIAVIDKETFIVFANECQVNEVDDGDRDEGIKNEVS